MSSSPRRGRRTGSKRGKRKQPQPPSLRTVDETSAGGLVLNPAHSCAAIIGRLDRRGKLLWSLPKGHIERGETQEQTAVREVAEETGVEAQVLNRLGSIDYWFIAGGRRIHKTVHHFLLEWRSGELSDADIEVTEVAWMPITDLLERLAYPDERKLVRVACELLGIELADGSQDSGTAAENN
jgi:8-oxo-dGTP pyrophosphatase MutT (NUDIX family)